MATLRDSIHSFFATKFMYGGVLLIVDTHQLIQNN